MFLNGVKYFPEASKQVGNIICVKLKCDNLQLKKIKACTGGWREDSGDRFMFERTAL